MVQHLQSLSPSQILEHVEIGLVTSISFWNEIDGPTKEVDSPLIYALNEESARLLDAIRSFRASNDA